jgi:lipid II:glycine glycyltransferase (peptidoglycan interpeptide bridge formation enzyme)
MINVSFISVEAAECLIDDIHLDLFQEIFWWKLIEQGFNKECLIALVSDNGVNKLIMPLFIHKVLFIYRVGSPLRGTYTPYMDFIKLSKNLDENDQEKYLHEIVKSLLKKGVNWIEVTCLSKRDEVFAGLKNVGFDVEHPSTMILDTNKSEEDLWNGMQGRARNLVRKSEKNGLKVEFLDCKEKNVKLFYSMLKDTFKKYGQLPPHSEEFYMLLTKRLLKSNNLLFLSIKNGADVVAMGIFMYNKCEINFMSGTSTRDGNKFGANNLMHWEVIKFAADNNISKYNFGGLGISSIDKFKRSFGGYEVGYSRYIWMKQYINLLFKMLIWVKSNLIMPLTMLLKGR